MKEKNLFQPILIVINNNREKLCRQFNTTTESESMEFV